MTVPRTFRNGAGEHVERRRVGYYPDDHDRHPGAKGDWVILCTVKGALGPMTELRTVIVSDWSIDMSATNDVRAMSVSSADRSVKEMGDVT
jgi:hypothetical protein